MSTGMSRTCSRIRSRARRIAHRFSSSQRSEWFCRITRTDSDGQTRLVRRRPPQPTRPGSIESDLIESWDEADEETVRLEPGSFLAALSKFTTTYLPFLPSLNVSSRDITTRFVPRLLDAITPSLTGHFQSDVDCLAYCYSQSIGHTILSAVIVSPLRYLLDLGSRGSSAAIDQLTSGSGDAGNIQPIQPDRLSRQSSSSRVHLHYTPTLPIIFEDPEDSSATRPDRLSTVLSPSALSVREAPRTTNDTGGSRSLTSRPSPSNDQAPVSKAGTIGVRYYAQDETELKSKALAESKPPVSLDEKRQMEVVSKASRRRRVWQKAKSLFGDSLRKTTGDSIGDCWPRNNSARFLSGRMRDGNPDSNNDRTACSLGGLRTGETEQGSQDEHGSTGQIRSEARRQCERSNGQVISLSTLAR